MNGSDRLLRIIRRAGTVAFDAMVFIYHFEDNPRYAELTEKVFALLDEGLVRGVTSIVTVAEVFSNQKVMDELKLMARYRATFQGWPGLVIHQPTIDEAMIIGGLRIRYGLRLPDAFQIGAAVQSGAEVFVTNDKALGRIAVPRVLLLEDYL